MSALISWSRGGQAAVAGFEGEQIRVLSTISAAPGTPLVGALVEAPDMGVQIKVHGCKRTPEGFVITGRVVNLTRALRAVLEKAIA
jgi:hypothetical protein